MTDVLRRKGKHAEKDTETHSRDHGRAGADTGTRPRAAKEGPGFPEATSNQGEAEKTVP